MTPSERNIVKALIAVAWADGRMEEQESSVIEGLLCGFDASSDEEAELVTYAKQRRTLEDIAVDALSLEEREILLANAALLTHADGVQTASEHAVVQRLVSLLGIPTADAQSIIDSARDGALQLGSQVLREGH